MQLANTLAIFATSRNCNPKGNITVYGCNSGKARKLN
jgi:hypothetical protein